MAEKRAVSVPACGQKRDPMCEPNRSRSELTLRAKAACPADSQRSCALHTSLAVGSVLLEATSRWKARLCQSCCSAPERPLLKFRRQNLYFSPEMQNVEKWPPVAELSKPPLRYPDCSKCWWFVIAKPDAVTEFILPLLSLCGKRSA